MNLQLFSRHTLNSLVLGALLFGAATLAYQSHENISVHAQGEAQTQPTGNIADSPDVGDTDETYAERCDRAYARYELLEQRTSALHSRYMARFSNLDLTTKRLIEIADGEGISTDQVQIALDDLLITRDEYVDQHELFIVELGAARDSFCANDDLAGEESLVRAQDAYQQMKSLARSAQRIADEDLRVRALSLSNEYVEPEEAELQETTESSNQ